MDTLLPSSCLANLFPGSSTAIEGEQEWNIMNPLELLQKKKKSRISYAIVKYVASFLPVMGQPSLTIIM